MITAGNYGTAFDYGHLIMACDYLITAHDYGVRLRHDAVTDAISVVAAARFARSKHLSAVFNLGWVAVDEGIGADVDDEQQVGERACRRCPLYVQVTVSRSLRSLLHVQFSPRGYCENAPQQVARRARSQAEQRRSDRGFPLRYGKRSCCLPRAPLQVASC